MENIFKNTKIIEVGPVKIHLQAVDSDQEDFIDAVVSRQYKSLEDQDRAGSEYVRRLISCMVKKVEGVKLNGVEWNVKFIDTHEREIDMSSYVVLKKVLDKISTEQNFVAEIAKFYNDQKQELLDGISFVNDDKKKE